jgi:glycosyltransferase involved in cell wall biosynthesis
VTDQEKFDALAAADLLVMPSQYESLSMVTLEAWALGRPVLANGRCDVLCGQCIRSNGGLYYENYEEFSETLHAIVSSSSLRDALGTNGRAYFTAHYTWPVIERKYLNMLDRLDREEAHAVYRPEPLPGWFGRRRRDLPPGRQVVDRLPTGPAPRPAEQTPVVQ